MTRRQGKLHHWDGTVPEKPAAVEQSIQKALSGRKIARLCLKTETGVAWLAWLSG